MTKTLSVTNFKGARSITLSPTGSMVVIAGPNGAGKSSFIDAFVELFDPKGTRLTPKPIHDGEDEARAEYEDTDLGVRIVRTWKKDDAGKLEVFALDGAKYSRPTDFVAELTGGLIFDPVAFLNLDEKKQRDALLAKVNLPIDLDEVAREKAGAESRRLDAGREVKRLEGALSALTAPAIDAPTVEVSGSAILTEIAEAQQHNTAIQRQNDLAAELMRGIDGIDRRIGALELEIKGLQSDRCDAVDRLNAADAAALAPLIELAPMQSRLAAVDATNAAVRAARDYQMTFDALADQKGLAIAAQSELDRIEARKRAALATAEFPIDGLSVDDNGITFEGVPFVQVNSAARRRVAFAIATAGDPKLKLVIIKDGDLLDGVSLAGIADLASERGYTVLVERDRDESRQIGFTIADGVLAEAVA